MMKEGVCMFQVAKSIINCIVGGNRKHNSFEMQRSMSGYTVNGLQICSAKIGFVSIMLIRLAWLMKSVDVNLDSI